MAQFIKPISPSECAHFCGLFEKKKKESTVIE